MRSPNILSIALASGLYAASSSIHLAYAVVTRREDEIVIRKKYKMVRGGMTDFMVIDSRGKHFRVNNSLWYWKWDSVEDWSTMTLDTPVKITYYGHRIPLFGIFPNIVSQVGKGSPKPPKPRETTPSGTPFSKVSNFLPFWRKLSKKIY